MLQWLPTQGVNPIPAPSAIVVNGPIAPHGAVYMSRVTPFCSRFFLSWI